MNWWPRLATDTPSHFDPWIRSCKISIHAMNEPGAPHHDVERSECQVLPCREPRYALHDELKVGFDRREIDLLLITPRQG